MRVFSLGLGQFSISALVATVLFRYILSLCIGMNSWILTLLCSATYFCCMFLCGWHFGKKDSEYNGIHDIGFRFHAVTYMLCISISCLAWHIGWNTEGLSSIIITAISWGIGLIVHFIFFLIEYKKTIRGYAKDELFE